MRMEITYTAEGPIARIAFAAPPVNALTVPLMQAFLAALRRAGEDDAVRAIIIESSVSRYFCAGLNLSVLKDAPDEGVRQILSCLYTELMDAQFALRKPTIAAVAGAARGGGMTIAVSCNVIVAGEQASFGYPELDVAMLPAIHLAHLPQIVGRHRAYELLFTGRTFDATEARELGLVSRIAPGSVIDEAMALAQTFAAKPPEAFRTAHAAFMDENDHRASVQRAVDLFCENAVSEHGRRGIASFSRPPRS
jgi:enoyl-CoA hydratase/carnithine racemase